MASYQSRRNYNSNNDSEEMSQNQSSTSEQEKNSSKKVAKTAAKGAATYFGGQLGGKTVDALSKTKAGDKLLNKGGEAINNIPGMGRAAKKLDESGALDKADKAMDIAGGASKGGAVNKADSSLGKAGGSSSKSGGDSSSSLNNKNGSGLFNNFFNSGNENQEKEESTGKNNSSRFNIKIPLKVKIIVISLLPAVFLVLFLILLISSVFGVFSNFNDALGISQETGFSTGDVEYIASSEEEKNFYKRVTSVKKEYESRNISVDALKIVSVYHILNYHNNNIDYDYMTTSRIEKIVDASLDYSENSGTYYYSEDIFRENLTNNIFKSYFPNKSESQREKYTEEVFEYIEKYYDMIGYNTTSSCAAVGTCSYDIKGFYIYKKGNINKNLNINNLKVRLMQSGTANGHNYGGTFGQPLAGEELVDFEKYILGVAYAEVGSSYPDEAIKAQMVAARSYILARSTDMGGWRTLKQESNGWVLQAAASTQDQVYCDPDKGCSSNDAQWQQVYSGTNLSGIKTHKTALSQDARMRSLANETMGEVLVNSQGYIIYSGYLQTEQTKFKELANLGYNYKQILLEVYNSDDRPYGASDIVKMGCNTTGETCTQAVTGDYASWKQYQGDWIYTPMGTSGKNIKQIGCLATSVAMQIARSGVETNIEGELNPGTFVEYLNTHGGFTDGGNFVWSGATSAAPRFKFVDRMTVMGYTREQKYEILTDLINQGYYVVAEVKGSTGQHWVAVVSTQNGEVTMMDPGSASNSMWTQYSWKNTSAFAYYRVS